MNAWPAPYRSGGQVCRSSSWECTRVTLTDVLPPPRRVRQAWCSSVRCVRKCVWPMGMKTEGHSAQGDCLPAALSFQCDKARWPRAWCLCLFVVTTQEAPRMREHRDVCTILIYRCGRLPLWSSLGNEAASYPNKVWHVEVCFSLFFPF